MSKKLFSTLIMVVTSVGVANASQYLQASSAVTQCPGTAPEVVAMEIVDAANGITLANNKISIGEAGPYLIVAAPQVGREGVGPYGCFDLWLRINGADVANSNVQLCQDEGSRGQGRHHLAGHRPHGGGGYAGSGDVGEQPGGGDVHRSDPAVR